MKHFPPSNGSSNFILRSNISDNPQQQDKIPSNGSSNIITENDVFGTPQQLNQISSNGIPNLILTRPNIFGNPPQQDHMTLNFQPQQVPLFQIPYSYKSQIPQILPRMYKQQFSRTKPWCSYNGHCNNTSINHHAKYTHQKNTLKCKTCRTYSFHNASIQDNTVNWFCTICQTKFIKKNKNEYFIPVHNNNLQHHNYNDRKIKFDRNNNNNMQEKRIRELEQKVNELLLSQQSKNVLQPAMDENPDNAKITIDNAKITADNSIIDNEHQ